MTAIGRSGEDRRSGFSDRLSDQSDKPYSVGIDLGDPEARNVWHAALAENLRSHNARSVKTLTGRFGWFWLRLTRDEVIQVVRSAWGEGVVELEGDRGPCGEQMDDSERRWRLTEKGERLRPPRGAGYSDFFRSFGDSARRSLATAKDLFGLAGLLLAAGLGITLKEDGVLARSFLTGAVWFFFVVLTISAYRDEHALTACAKSWDRLRVYRPKRFESETTPRRTPGPAAILAWVTLAAAVVLWWCVWDGRKNQGGRWQTLLGDGRWNVVCVVAIVLALVILIVYLVFEWRAQKLRNAYVAEQNKRKERYRTDPHPGRFARLVAWVSGTPISEQSSR